MMHESCLKKQRDIIKIFEILSSKEDKYQKLIDLGRKSTPIAEENRTPECVVPGCQSTLYLRSHKEGEAVYFEAHSDALISSGLAEILIRAYSGETPETILKCPPDYLETLELGSSLTPNRANGLYSIHLRMKQDALKFLVGSG